MQGNQRVHDPFELGACLGVAEDQSTHSRTVQCAGGIHEVCPESGSDCVHGRSLRACHVASQLVCIDQAASQRGEHAAHRALAAADASGQAKAQGAPARIHRL
ncbi:hypothetical protein D3C71_1016990 [compost metagenome]